MFRSSVSVLILGASLLNPRAATIPNEMVERWLQECKTKGTPEAC